jgi:hypothetical protein
MPGDAAPVHALFVVPGGANGSRDGAAITPRFTARAATATVKNTAQPMSWREPTRSWATSAPTKYSRAGAPG